MDRKFSTSGFTKYLDKDGKNTKLISADKSGVLSGQNTHFKNSERESKIESAFNIRKMLVPESKQRSIIRGKYVTRDS